MSLDKLESHVVVSASALALPLEPYEAADVVDGTPLVGAAELGHFGGVEIGVWEMTAGSARDTEVDEVFVVLSGTASVRFLDDDTTITLAAGDVVRLREGQRTVWTITETLRKIYIC